MFRDTQYQESKFLGASTRLKECDPKSKRPGSDGNSQSDL